MLKDKTLTYISLFSCAGVGCFGFKKAGFECIATNELIERRINVQKFNDKCKFDSGLLPRSSDGLFQHLRSLKFQFQE